MKIQLSRFLCIILSILLLSAWLISCDQTPTPSESDSNATPDTEEPSVSGCAHNYQIMPGQAASCEEDGYTEHRFCLNCHEIDGYTVIPGGHNYQSIAGTDATCTRNGYTSHRVCRRCGHKDGYTVIVGEHDYVDIPEKPATPTSFGYTAHKKCTVCGKKEGYEELKDAHVHRLTESSAGEHDPLFMHCTCGFAAVTDLRSRPLIDQLGERQYEQFLRLYNLFKHREAFCELDISAAEYDLFYQLLQGQCPELFLLEYQNAAPIAFYDDAGRVYRAEWNPACMSDTDYAKACEIMLDTLFTWEADCRGLSDAEKVQYLVHWLVENTDFVTIGTHVRSLYGALIEKEIACVGYAQVLSWALNSFGIPCMSVGGVVGDEGHMWNLVQLNGDWYQVDAGWNYVNIHGTNYSSDAYVNVTDADLRIGSTRVYYNVYAECGIQIPVCRANEQSLARLHGHYVDSPGSVSAAFRSALIRACQNGEDTFTLICNSPTTQDAIYTHAQNASDVAQANGVKIYWFTRGHDNRTNIYYVTVLLARPNQSSVTFTAAKPQPNVGYKLALSQNQNGQTVFFSGSVTEKYLSTVADPNRATDVFYKPVDGGFRLWFMDGYLKKYIDIVSTGAGTAQAIVSLTPTAVFRFDQATSAIVTTLDGKDFWLGTYNNHPTIGACNISYISGNHAGNIHVSQFPAQLVTVDGMPPNTMDEPPIPQAHGTAYTLQMQQNILGKVLYFSGKHNGHFLASTTARSASPSIYMEVTDGGVHLYYLWGENKLYLNVQGFSNRGVSLLLRPTPGAPFTYNDALGVYTVRMYDAEYYLGSYNSYDNFSLSNVQYISGANASKVDVSQFPARLVPNNR